MFNNLGWGEIIVILLVGLFVFGPDKLPKAIADFKRLVRTAREAVSGLSHDFRSELGPELGDLDLRSLRSMNPRRFLEEQLFGDDDLPPAPPSVSYPTGALLRPGERPPYDPDAT